MKIAQIGKFYFPVHGGMERVVCELSEGLVHAGHQVRTFVASQGGNSGRENINGVDVVRLKTIGNLFSQPMILGLEKELNDFNPDVVQFHLPNPLALHLGFNSKYRSCLTIHAEAGGIRGPVDRFFTKSFAQNSNALIFSSDQMQDLWLRGTFGGLRKKSTVIPFGFRFSYLTDADANPPQDTSLILFIGRLVHYKGIETLVQAMTRVDGKLCIVGSGPQRNSLETLAAKLGVSNKIKFLGSIPDQDLAKWLKTCSVYVQPSVSSSEAFGISMLEAMSIGRPIVSTDLPTGVQSVNQHLRTGLVVPKKNSLSLALAINTLIKDQVLAKKFGSNAAEHARKFNFNAMIQSHILLYQSLVEKIPNQAKLREVSQFTL